jgi:hypothetical protein
MFVRDDFGVLFFLFKKQNKPTWIELYGFRARHPRRVDRITSVGKMRSNTTFSVYIAKRCFYIASLNDFLHKLCTNTS